MDNPQPNTQVTQPVSSTPPPPRQNTTIWIILSFLLVATVLTGFAYIFIQQPTDKKKLTIQNVFNNKTQETISPSPTAVTNTPEWKTYSNTKYEYSFDYPVTWEVAKTDADEKNIELHYVASPELAIIHIEYLSAEERAKIPPTYCEIGGDTDRCHSYQLSDKSEAIIDSDYREKTSKDEAMVSHPTNGGTLRIRITDTNAESKNAFLRIIYSLNYPAEK